MCWMLRWAWNRVAEQYIWLVLRLMPALFRFRLEDFFSFPFCKFSSFQSWKSDKSWHLSMQHVLEIQSDKSHRIFMDRIFWCLISRMISLSQNRSPLFFSWWKPGDYYFLTCLHGAFWVESVNGAALCRILQHWWGAILVCNPLIKKSLLIISQFRAQRTHLLESILQFPGEIEKKMSYIQTFFFFLLLL